MTPPRRLLDDGPDAIRDLLKSAPRTTGISLEQKARSRARLGRAAVGIAAGAGSLAILQGAAIGASLGLIGAGVVWLAPSPGTMTSSAPVAVVAPPRAERPELPPVIVPPPVPTVAVSATRVSPPAQSASPPSAPIEDAGPSIDSLAEEAALLEQARAALASSPAEALALTRAHAAKFAGGKLAMERELLAVDALRRLGKRSEAKARAEALLQRAHGGLYEERLQKLVRDLE